MIFFDPAHRAIGKLNRATPVHVRLGRKTDLVVTQEQTDEQIDIYLSSLPPPAIDLSNEKLLKRKNELFSIFSNYVKVQVTNLVNLKKSELKELKDTCLDNLTNTKKRTMEINGKKIPLHINGRISAMFILTELYEHHLEPNSEDIKLLLGTLDDHINFPVYGKEFHHDTVENAALLKSMIARTVAKAALQLKDPPELQLSIISSLHKIDRMLKKELKNRKSYTLSNARRDINKGIFITSYYYNQSAAKRTGKKLKPLPEWLTKNSLKVLSMNAETVLKSENLQS